MYNAIASAFVVELRHRRSDKVIVSDSSDDEVIEEPKRARGRPKKERIREETIEYIKSSVEAPVLEVNILGVIYNKCIYSNDLYDDLGSLVGWYDLESHTIEKVN